MDNKRYMLVISIVALSLSAKTASKTPSTSEKVNFITTTNNRDQIGVKTAPASPVLTKSNGYVSAAALIWNILQDAQDIAYNEKITETGTNIYNPINVQTLNWGWNLGFKASAGFRTSKDDWDFSMNFAYLQAKRRYHNVFNGANTSGGTQFFVYPLSGVLEYLSYANKNFTFDQSFSFEKFHQMNRLNLYDANIDLAREFFVSKKLSLKPIAGAKGTYIYQHSKVNFSFIYTNLTQPVSSTGKLNIKNDFWGVGPQLGSGLRFGFTKHFSLDCQFDAAMLWGKMLTKQLLNYNILNLQSVLVPFITPAKATKYQMVPNVNLLAGFTFDSNFSDNTKNIALNVSYENRYFWNNIGTFTPLTRQKGSTSFQGLTAGLQLSY